MNSIITIACASITGLTLGIALNHKQNLSNVRPSQLIQAKQVAVDRTQISSLTDHSSAPTIVTNSASTPGLIKKIEELTKQVEELSIQHAESNRELSAIQFRLDTHSQSFRPLRAENNSTFTSPTELDFGNNQVLPPRL